MYVCLYVCMFSYSILLYPPLSRKCIALSVLNKLFSMQVNVHTLVYIYIYILYMYVCVS